MRGYACDNKKMARKNPQCMTDIIYEILQTNSLTSTRHEQTLSRSLPPRSRRTDGISNSLASTLGFLDTEIEF